MNVKISTFKSRLQHSPSFENEIDVFIKNIEKESGCSLQYADLDDYECDLKLIFIQTGGSEGLFLKNFDKLKEPYCLLTNGSNNSLAASLEILTYLEKIGKKGEIIHGSINYVAKRIRELAAVSNAVKQLKNTRLGVIGKPSDWLISSVPDYGEVKRKLGVTLLDVDITEIEKSAKNSNINVNTEQLPAFDENEIVKAVQIYDALNSVTENLKLDGLTIRCFDLLSSLKSTGCIALSELNRRGIIGTCEGDVAAMLSMRIAKILTGQTGFQANPSRIDAETNTVVFAHCAVPFDMVEDYKFDTHFESGIGVAVKGELKTGKVTVFRLSSDLKRYFVSQGELLRNLNESNLCRTQAVVKLDNDVTQLLKHPCGNHHVVMYGEHARLISLLMDELLK